MNRLLNRSGKLNKKFFQDQKKKYSGKFEENVKNSSRLWTLCNGKTIPKQICHSNTSIGHNVLLLKWQGNWKVTKKAGKRKMRKIPNEKSWKIKPWNGQTRDGLRNHFKSTTRCPFKKQTLKFSSRKWVRGGVVG